MLSICNGRPTEVHFDSRPRDTAGTDVIHG